VKKETQNISTLMECIGAFTSLLTDAQREEFVANVSIHKFKKNESIYKEGDVPQMLLCLLTGKVKIYKEGVGGRAQIMQAIRPSDLFGYRAYFSNQNYITAAAAFETSVIAMISMQIVDKWVAENPKLANYFIRRVSMELGNTQERIVSLTQKHIRGRLAETLLFLKENFGMENDGQTLSISLSREDMANLSNMTTSNAIRTLSAFAAEGLILLDGRRIMFTDEEKLKHISKMG
jgi:CRP-like cAMP-binding protein